VLAAANSGSEDDDYDSDEKDFDVADDVFASMDSDSDASDHDAPRTGSSKRFKQDSLPMSKPSFKQDSLPSAKPPAAVKVSARSSLNTLNQASLEKPGVTAEAATAIFDSTMSGSPRAGRHLLQSDWRFPVFLVSHRR
jgi:hypothetical protein